jgi:Sulfotransferase family
MLLLGVVVTRSELARFGALAAEAMFDPTTVRAVGGIRSSAWTVAMYANSGARVAVRARSLPRLHSEGRQIFVVGAPRSGTTFLASSLAAQSGLVDLGEVQPLKAAIPELVGLPEPEAADRFRRTLERVRRLGLSWHLRGVEQTPETAFVLPAVVRAYPDADVVHVVRDGRDVVCSLLDRGWLSAGRGGRDDAHARYGSHLRFWVEPERAEEFVEASDSKRAAWAWRRYTSVARDATTAIEVRYEDLATDPRGAAARLARALQLDAGRLAEALSQAHARSVGRWRRDLTAEQLGEVEHEAGALLRELEYSAAGVDAPVQRDAPPVLKDGEDP